MEYSFYRTTHGKPLHATRPKTLELFTFARTTADKLQYFNMSNPSALVSKLWNYCSILRDDGLSYGDYVEQLTFLLFLKMAEEQSQPPFNKPSSVPKGYDWPGLLAKPRRQAGVLCR